MLSEQLRENVLFDILKNFHLSLQHSYHSIEEVHFFVNDTAKLPINDLLYPLPVTVWKYFNVLIEW